MQNNKKPKSIDFSDNNMLNDNKLASDEMERLLAEALSSRNRELEMLSMNNNENTSKTAEEWISGSSDNVTNTNANNIKRPIQKNITSNNVIQHKKNVSFNDNENEEIIYEKDTNHNETNNNINSKKIENNELSFLSKLKLKLKPITPDSENDSISIPLDEYNTEFDNEDNKILSNDIYISTNEKTRDARDARDSRDYDKLEIKITSLGL